MNERDELRLRHMRDAANSALDFVAGLTQHDLEINILLEYAVLHALQIIGEAGSKITVETRQQYPQIPWKDIIGIRQRIVHDYDSVKFDIVWNTVTNDLPMLIRQLDQILPPFVQDDEGN